MSLFDYLNATFDTKIAKSSLTIHPGEVAYCQDDSFVAQIRPANYLRIQLKHEDFTGTDWLNRIKSVDAKQLFEGATQLLKNTHIKYDDKYDVDGYCASKLTLYYVDLTKDWYAYTQGLEKPTLCMSSDITGLVSMTRFYLHFI